MDLMIIGKSQSGWLRNICATLCLASLALSAGCPGFTAPAPNANVNGSGSENDNGGDAAELTVKIASFQNNFELSALEEPVSVIYSVTTDDASMGAVTVSGFYVQVADAVTGSAPIADAIITHPSLLAGAQQAFSFDPATVGIGFYRVGVIATVGETQQRTESSGIIQVQGPPSPRFIRPTEAITEVEAGADVIISFDAGDPEGLVQWRLFYLQADDSRDVSPDVIGTQLQVGSGNVNPPFTFSTTGFEPGDYEIGLSATDTGLSVATAVTNGRLDRIVTIPRTLTDGEVVSGPIIRVVDQRVAQLPTITFEAPGTDTVDIFGDQTFTIRYTAEVNEPNTSGLVDVFYDDDRNEGNRTFPIAVNLPDTTSSVPLDTSTIQEDGTYYVGARIRDGKNPEVVKYADGSLVVVRTGLLEVIDPSFDVSLAPSPAGTDANIVEVTWNTNVPESVGLVDVFAKALDSTFEPTGSEIPVLNPPTSLTETTAEFSNADSGLYEIFVRITFSDGVTAPLVRSAPGFVRVSSLPKVLWLGALASGSPQFDGAIFEGVNEEDNAGNAFAAPGDVDGNGTDDLLIAARYGKPFAATASGVGPGEAYLLFGSPGRLTGSFNLNAVGTEQLPGVAFTGIRTAGNNDNTDGLAAVASIPDVDGDGSNELAFGFPYADSRGFTVGMLEAAGQFLNGGVVIVSSANSAMTNIDGADSVINLDMVGQAFSNMTVEPGNEVNAIDDQQRFENGACVEGNDGIDDTIIGPSVGFIPLLAPQLYEQLGFAVIGPGTVPSPNVCPTQFDPAACDDPGSGNGDPFGPDASGSGFYAGNAFPLEPLGARIIGYSPGDRFGSGLAMSNALSDDSSGDLVVTAPNRSAAVEEFDTNVLSSDIANAGVAFLAQNRNLWGSDFFSPFAAVPPTPYQYAMRLISHCGDGRAAPIGQFSIAGDTNDRLRTVVAIKDTNGDGRNDIAVGAPEADQNRGRVYVVHRRQPDLENGFVLGQSSDRLLITSSDLDSLGASLATGVDFNGDGAEDLVIGAPNALGGVGGVYVVFSDPSLVSPAGGITVGDLIQDQSDVGLPARAVRITGNALDGAPKFGFNVADAGDVTGDGLNDLLIAAPNATPRYDPDPTDSIDLLTAPGVDMNLDGFPDTAADLTSAGVVYVISGATRLDRIPADLGTLELTIGIEQLGTSLMPGFMIAGRRAGDRIGGGDAGSLIDGGSLNKDGKGRSYGLSSAGDFDNDGRDDILIGSVLADPRLDATGSSGADNGGEAYLIYGVEP